MEKKTERVQKGIKFYDTKGKGYVKGGVKTYEETLDEISPANPARIKQPNPYSLSKKLKMIIRSIGAGPIKEKDEYIDESAYTDFAKKFGLDPLKDYAKIKRMMRQQNLKGVNDWSKGPYKKGDKMYGEGTLHQWFKGSKSKDGKPGWVNVKTGGTCASDEPGEGTPKCVSSSKRASMSKAERESASRRKKAADPGQQSKTGAAKPTYVPTDKPKKKMKEENQITEADKKGKGSGTKDACYHKVKSRYSVWPSAYASGALVKCRKVGAANWGNSKKEEFEGNLSYTSFMEKCWKGYEKKGMKTMFGKRYPNCVKKEETEVVREDDMKGMSVKSGHKRPTKSGAGMTKKGVEAYRRRNPGSKLKTAVTTPPSKLKAGSKAANRRKSYCARSAGQMKKFPKAAKDPNSRLRQARRRWNC